MPDQKHRELCPMNRTVPIFYMVTIRCDDCGFDCDYTTAGEIERVVSEYWDHMSIVHGIEYSPETLAKYVLKKIPTKIPAS